MFVLIVGPSGVGKSTLCRGVASMFPNVRFFRLDDEVAKWAFKKGMIVDEGIEPLLRKLGGVEFLRAGLHVVKKLVEDHPGTDIVIDVGAGFLFSPEAEKLHHVYTMVAITADPAVAHNRIVSSRPDQRSLEEYEADEYSVSRLAIHNSAHRQVETTGRTEEESVNMLAGILVELFQPPC